MARISNSSIRRHKHRALLAETKGYRLKRKNVFKRAQEAVLKAGPYSYVHRRLKKRTVRRTWNIQINAAARQNGTTYSALITGLKKNKIELNRKTLAEIAKTDPEAFASVAKLAAK